MFIEKRTNRTSVTFSVVYYGDDGKRRRLKQSEHPKFSSKEDGEAWCKAQEAIYATRKAAQEKKLSWRNTYYDFNDLLTLFTAYQKKQAPNSWEGNVGYLQNWIFPFFLNLQHMGNVNDWPSKFQEFRDWISSGDLLNRKGKKKELARHTQNNIIKTLNVFLTCLGEYGKIDEASVKKCKALPHDHDADITLDDIILPAERDLVYRTMLKLNPAAAEFFYVMWHTGMRFSELFGLTIVGQGDIPTLRKGHLKNLDLHNKWDKAGLNYRGWIYLDSQPENDVCKRGKDKSLKRKPLKWCPAINIKWARCIPIESEEVFKIMARRYLAAKARHEKRQFTALKIDYRYFEDLTWGEANLTLARAFEELGLQKKSYHKCRHSFATFFKHKTGTEVTMQVTGHRKIETLAKYDHINELLAMQARDGEEDDFSSIE